jgi:hypothetical protein
MSYQIRMNRYKRVRSLRSLCECQQSPEFGIRTYKWGRPWISSVPTNLRRSLFFLGQVALILVCEMQVSQSLLVMYPDKDSALAQFFDKEITTVIPGICSIIAGEDTWVVCPRRLFAARNIDNTLPLVNRAFQTHERDILLQTELQRDKEIGIWSEVYIKQQIEDAEINYHFDHINRTCKGNAEKIYRCYCDFILKSEYGPNPEPHRRWRGPKPNAHLCARPRNYPILVEQANVRNVWYYCCIFVWSSCHSGCTMKNISLPRLDKNSELHQCLLRYGKSKPVSYERLAHPHAGRMPALLT